jgi:hypothetical protein
VLASLGQQRVADHPAVIGVFVDRLGRKFFVPSELAADRGDLLRPALRQSIQMLLHPRPGRCGVPLRERQQADGEVGHPITLLAECSPRAIRMFDDAEQTGRFANPRRIVGQYARQGQVRCDDDEKARTRQQDQPRSDGQPNHHRAPVAVRPPQ